MLAPSSNPVPSQAEGLISLRGGLGAVPGVRLAGVHAGIKARKRDLALIVFDAPQVCASVVTTNEIKAAPILVSAEHLARSPVQRALVCNSGCANACTGDRGDRDARATARQAAALLGMDAAEVIVASTGVIGVPLPMDRLQRGLERAVAQLEDGGKSAFDAAESITTTDRVPKLAAYAFYHNGRKYVVGGIAKGSGMIAPSMATMLAFIATDFPMSRDELQAMLASSTDESFNMISVDGDMSTNDAVYAFAPPPHRHAEPPPCHAEPPPCHAEPPPCHAEPVEAQSPPHCHAEPSHCHAEPSHCHAEPSHCHAEPSHCHAEPVEAQSPPHCHAEPVEACDRAFRRVCLDLAYAMVADGEGATKTLEAKVTGAADLGQARAVARAIVNSNLVRTALYGEDPNWGRIIAAAGAARAGLDVRCWSLDLNEKPWVGIDAIELLSEAEAHRELESARISIELKLGLGDARATAWGCDLSRDYVRINANYRT